MFGLFGLLSGRNGRHTPQMRRKLLLIRLGLIVPLLVAVFVLHLSGTDLVILRVVRIALLLGVIVVFRGLGRGRGAASAAGASDSTEPQ
jgi:hypothetical protein